MNVLEAMISPMASLRVDFSDGFADASARCARGTLVGGGCSVGYRKRRSTHVSYSLALIHPIQAAGAVRGEVRASKMKYLSQPKRFALKSRIPEDCDCCDNLTESIEVRREIRSFVEGTNRLQVSCEPGEHLLLGNCVLDGVETSELTDVSMFRHGFPPGDDDTWGCSWNNPAGVEATAIATAFCLPE